MKQKKIKKIPQFNTETQERQFWQSVDSTKYVDYANMQNAQFPNLKLSTKPITIRLPQIFIDRLKIRAHKLDIPYQVLIKQFIFAGLSH